MLTCLKDLAVGKRGRITALCCHGPIRRRLLDMGLIEGTIVECLGRAPLGDPSAYLIRGAVVALRGEDSRHIKMEEVKE